MKTAQPKNLQLNFIRRHTSLYMGAARALPLGPQGLRAYCGDCSARLALDTLSVSVVVSGVRICFGGSSGHFVVCVWFISISSLRGWV